MLLRAPGSFLSFELRASLLLHSLALYLAVPPMWFLKRRVAGLLFPSPCPQHTFWMRSLIPTPALPFSKAHRNRLLGVRSGLHSDSSDLFHGDSCWNLPGHFSTQSIPRLNGLVIFSIVLQNFIHVISDTLSSLPPSLLVNESDDITLIKAF